MSDSESTLEVFSRRFARWLFSAGCDVSLIDDFVRMRRYRERASEFELLAENEPLSEVRLRYRIIAHHYRELADRDERKDKAKMVERLEMLKLARRKHQSRCRGLAMATTARIILAVASMIGPSLANGSPACMTISEARAKF